MAKYKLDRIWSIMKKSKYKVKHLKWWVSTSMVSQWGLQDKTIFSEDISPKKEYISSYKFY